MALSSVGNQGRVVRAVSGARADMTNARVAVSADIAGSGNALHGRAGDRGVALRLRVVVCAVVGCVTLALWLASAERAAASGWAIQAAPAVPGLTSGRFSAVLCTSRTACTAVGSYTNKANIVLPLAERWNGANWSIQRTPHPAGARSTSLSGVSCTSRTACIAVGSYTNKANIVLPLAERWNGANWSIQRTPHPAGARSTSLSGVSCTSRTACIAVGSYTNKANIVLPLAERWNGANWSIQRTPHPAGAKRASLSGVSCTSRVACTAVGGFGKPFNPELQPIGAALAERWNGTRWTIQRTPKPPGATSASLSGVSCTSRIACTAVGNLTKRFNPMVQSTGAALAERWNGTRWTIQSTPSAAGAIDPSLSAVACTSRTACIAVGSYINSAYTVVTLAQRWNGARWTIRGTPDPAGATSTALSGVWCTSRTACTTVGSFTSSAKVQLTVAERWSGTGWSIQRTRNPLSGASSSVLNGVSCTSATACTAVGSYTNSAGAAVALAERWNGTSWTIQQTPNPSSASSSVLNGVSCYSATACTAVGSYTNSAGTQLALAEAWNGTSWTIQKTGGGGLSSVSCPSATACVAVGGSLSEIWDGSSWTIQNTGGGGLSSVSCPSATACVAVGGSLSEIWDGTSWTIQNTPNLDPQDGRTALNGVSCSSATACTAVGNWGGYRPHDSTVVAERWDGTTWTLQSVDTDDADNGLDELNGVSCTSATACTAVGILIGYEGPILAPVAEAWNGTSWTIQNTPTPSGAGYPSQFNAVSCTSATACTAVGSYPNKNGSPADLGVTHR